MSEIDPAIRAVEEALSAYGVSCSDPGMDCDYTLVSGGGTCSTQCAEITLTYDYESEPLIPLPLVGFAMSVWLWTSLSGQSLRLGLIWLAVGIAYLAWLTRGFRRPPPEMDFAEADVETGMAR